MKLPVPNKPGPKPGPKKPPLNPAQTRAQAWLPVREIRQGCLVRRDGAVVAGVKIAPFSLALKSERERVAVIQSFQAAVNALTVPWQIVSMYRAVDLAPYLTALEQAQASLQGTRRELLRQYQQWVTGLVARGEVAERRYALLTVRQGKNALAEQIQEARHLAAALEAIRGFRVAPLSDRVWSELMLLVFHAGVAGREGVPDLGPLVPAPVCVGGMRHGEKSDE